MFSPLEFARVGMVPVHVLRGLEVAGLPTDRELTGRAVGSRDLAARSPIPPARPFRSGPPERWGGTQPPPHPMGPGPVRDGAGRQTRSADVAVAKGG